MDMEIKPIGENILIKRYESATMSRGGIFIPAPAQDKSIHAVVVAVGRGKTLKDGSFLPPAVKPGDDILIAKWGGNVVKIGDEEHEFIKEDEILAIIE